MADTSIVERRSQLSESQSALLQREKELEEKEKHLMDMVKSKSSDETVLQNLSACLAAERQALAHRWSELCRVGDKSHHESRAGSIFSCMQPWREASIKSLGRSVNDKRG